MERCLIGFPGLPPAGEREMMVVLPGLWEGKGENECAHTFLQAGPKSLESVAGVSECFSCVLASIAVGL